MNDKAPTRSAAPDQQYLVVARRYRPQNFDQLVGQQQATRALRNAIETHRVGHAYLFTGARGVGKTSTARIFSKALNCEQGPTTTPCDACDICEGIAAGSDVDVLEIDGASNRGIDEIRQLRSNVNVRPSRARFKIYIIDEVHMLTKEAFNALLKTLEEPPGHVKFIFCTTDPERIPITVVSRCQRFDFAPVERAAIVERLAEIVTAEGGTAEPAALDLLARRAAGSMRDSQSLLEQLLAFGGDEVTVEGVHQLLGTADSSSIGALVESLGQRDAAGALQLLDSAVQQGVDVGQLTEQLLGYLRDVMLAVVGASGELLRQAAPSELPELKALGDRWGLETVLAAAQILDHSLARMRHSVDRRTLIETALVRISHLEDLRSLSDLIGDLQRGGDGLTAVAATPQRGGVEHASASVPPAGEKGSAKKKAEDEEHPAQRIRPTEEDAGSRAAGQPTPSTTLTRDNATIVWNSVVDHVRGIDANFARNCSSVELVDEDQLVVSFASSINAERCRRPQQHQRLETILEQLSGRRVRIDFRVVTAPSHAEATPVRRPSQQALIRQALEKPLVKEALELFDADVKRVLESEPVHRRQANLRQES